MLRSYAIVRAALALQQQDIYAASAITKIADTTYIDGIPAAIIR